ncbi:MAG: toprim domain-containing protein [Solirubrobacteraceae bacterium]
MSILVRSLQSANERPQLLQRARYELAAHPASSNAAVRCFADPAAHSHGDRTPSCSVSLLTGAFLCHACGARGGAYDAALAAGRTPRAAMELLRAHDLIDADPGRRRPAAPEPILDSPDNGRRLQFAACDEDVRVWADSLEADGRIVRRLILERAWAPTTMRRLGLGTDGSRVTIPIRNAQGRLREVLRYQPFGRREPKMLAVPGTRLGLIPHPAAEPRQPVLLVEGPPDMIAARSAGLSAIAVPGTASWQPHWARLLSGRRVTIVMDCDAPGRAAANRIAASLRQAAAGVEIVDLAPGRSDGYDLSDRIMERRRARHRGPTARSLALLLRPDRTPQPRRQNHAA